MSTRNTLTVRGVADNASPNAIADAFAQYGTVTDVRRTGPGTYEVDYEGAAPWTPYSNRTPVYVTPRRGESTQAVVDRLSQYGPISSAQPAGEELQVFFDDERDAQDAVAALSGEINISTQPAAAPAGTPVPFGLPLTGLAAAGLGALTSVFSGKMPTLPGFPGQSPPQQYSPQSLPVSPQQYSPRVASPQYSPRVASPQYSPRAASPLPVPISPRAPSSRTSRHIAYDDGINLPTRTIERPFINYSQVLYLLNGDQVVDYAIDDMLQAYAGPPGTANKILLLKTRDNGEFITKVRYDPVTNKAYPPA